MDATGVRVWLDGGWAVDACLGSQTRRHGDLVSALCERFGRYSRGTGMRFDVAVLMMRPPPHVPHTQDPLSRYFESAPLAALPPSFPLVRRLGCHER